MANQKLTDLTQATTPLSGTEQVYVVQGGNSRRATAQQLADVPGEWSADTVTQAEAEAGTATTRRAWTALRVAQAVAAWWAGSAAKTKLDGIASGATANATDAQLRDRSTHTGTQAASTITGLATVATSGAYADLSGLPTLGTAAATDASAYATAAQGAKADSAVQPATLSAYVQTSDVRLTDSREWSAATIDQAEAEAGTATTRRAFTAQRVFQAIAAWWAASSAKTKLDGIAAGATANSSDATLLSRANHTGTQAAGTITGLATVATSGSYADLSSKPTIPGLSDATPESPGTAAAGTATSAARADHVHPLPPTVTTTTAGLMRPVDLGDVIILACSDETTDLATGTARVTFRMPWAATLTAVRLNVNTAPTGSALIVNVKEGGVSVFSTKPQIDAGARTSVGSSVTPVISDSALAADAEITVDIDQVGSTIKGKGLKVALYVTRVQA